MASRQRWQRLRRGRARRGKRQYMPYTGRRSKLSDRKAVKRVMHKHQSWAKIKPMKREEGK